MSSAFLQLFNMSITAGWIVLAVLLLRLCLKKAPRWITCLLWGLVALRLIIPFNIESPLSLIPSAETVVHTELESRPLIEVDSGFANIDKPINDWLSSSMENTAVEPPAPQPDVDSSTDSSEKDDVVAPPLAEQEESTPDTPSKSISIEDVLHIAAIVWLVGVGVMLLYEILSAIFVRRRVLDAVLLQDNVWGSDRIETPFIFGLFRPRIYVPYGLDESSLELVVAHERAHMRRCDHWIKPLAFTLLAVYWYNPLLWVAYFLLCRDIEVACDERVVRDLSEDDRRFYATALLKSGTERRTLMGCPLAFAEVSIKQRIFSIIGYRKPAVWVVMISLVVCILAALCLLTVPQSTAAQGIIDDVTTESTTGSTTGATTTVPSTWITSSTNTTPPTSAVKPTGTNHTHNYGEWTILEGPTCEKDGRRERVCSCGDTQVRTIDAVGHSYIRNVCVTCGDTNGTSFIPDYSVGYSNSIGNENGAYDIAIQDQWLYFSSNDYCCISKCRLDGTAQTVVYTIREGSIHNINVVGDWIYFSVNIANGSGSYIAKVRTDGSQFSYVIQSVVAREILVVYNTLYFTTINEPYYDYNNDCAPLYAMSLNGGMSKQIHDGYVSRLCSDGTYLYFQYAPQSGQDSLRRMDLMTGKCSSVLSKYNGRNLILKNNSLYFQEIAETTGDYVLRSISLMGNDKGYDYTYGNIRGADWFAVIGNCVYYQGVPDVEEWWNADVGIVEYFYRYDEYRTIYPYTDSAECVALGDYLVWHGYYSPIRLYNYYSETWIEVSSP